MDVSGHWRCSRPGPLVRGPVPMSKSEGPIYEFACHEGNHAMAGILAGARADEKATEEAAKKESK
jgi:hypothetical protein